MPASPAHATSNSAFESILEWSANWPRWEADALRRIVLQGDLKPGDIDELEQICKANHGLGVGKANPISKADIPVGPDASSSVSLIRLANLKNVNRIRDGAVMEFGPVPGLTVGFGDNGSGKSGYGRVIKRACRARGTGPHIKPNVLDPRATPPAMAQITCAVGSVETPINWRDGAPTDPRLSNIFVFDAASARLHLNEVGPAVFIPRGLDVLPKLARACDEIRGRLKRSSDATESEIEQAKQGWKCRPTTKIGKFVQGVTESTNIEVIEAMAAFTEAHRQRLVELTDALRADPRTKAQATTAAAGRVRTFAQGMRQRVELLAQKKLGELADATRHLAGAEAAAKATAGQQFDEGYLAWTGGEAWRELWEIARIFSTTAAYVGKAFPVVEEGAKCVLCQQTLDAQAKTRMVKFEDYVRSQSRVRADEARRELSAMAASFTSAQALKPSYDSVDADLAGQSADLLARIESFVRAADTLLAQVKASITSPVQGDLPALPPSPVMELIAIADQFDKRAEMEKSADDPQKRRLLEVERNELQDQEWLSGAKNSVISVVKERQLISQLKKCQDDTTTNSITIKSGELHDTYVTKAFCDRFAIELRALGFQTLPVKLESVKGAKGERKFGIKLDAPHGAEVADVASEGEQRTIALAAFLAELSQASHRSALVFDDPVCSLDHANRKRVARRLAEEARIRQVVVFTHDPVFLGELLEATEHSGIRCECVYLSWEGGAPGNCERGLPHDWQKYTERLNALDQDAAEINRTWNAVPNPQNVAAMRDAYSKLRATAEKIVQDVVFNGVVVRYRAYINLSPKMLKPVVGFCDAECDELLRLHKVACDCTEAHDPAAGKHAPVPNPADLRKDIADLRAVVDAIKARRKAAGY